MSVYHHNREPLGNRLSESPRRHPFRSWRVRRSTNHRPGLELLECRLVLSPTIFTVNSTGSGASGSGQSGTLPYVISQANVNANTAGSEIEFDSTVFSSPQMITLGATLVLSETAGPEVIDGPGSGLVTVSGGGMVSVFEINNGVTATLSGLTISDGRAAAGDGGGLQNYGTTTLTDCTISGNTAASNGGGVENDGSAALTNCILTGNVAASDGGGVDNTGTLVLTNSTFSTNTAAYGAGVANKSAGTAIATNSGFTNNTAEFDGGAIEAIGAVTLADDTLNGNSAGFDGGGIDHENIGDATVGPLTVGETTIANNIASSGGAIYNGNDSTTLITNATIANNSVYSDGGGIFEYSGSLTLTNSTIANNVVFPSGGAASGGGIFTKADTVLLTNTIVALNTDTGGAASDDIAGTTGLSSSSSFNLIGTGGSDGIINGQNGNLILTSLSGIGLSPLGDYGGLTETIALLPGSPAIGAGTSVSGVTTDQRGFPLDSPPDIGAFQVQTGLVVNTTIDGAGSASGDLSLRQAINLANVLASAQTITFDPTVFATAQTITLAGSQLELSNTSGMETIIGPAVGVTVSGGGLSRVFQVDATVTASISGLTISGGSANRYGGGLLNYGTATLTGCTITGNSLGYGAGGGLFNAATLTLSDCTISDNSSGGNGAGLADTGSAILNNCTVTGNSARDTAGSGGGLLTFDHGMVTLTDCTISGNSAGESGGGLLSGLGSVTTLTNCTVSGNSSYIFGGGLINYGTATLTGCTISGNYAGDFGGGLYNADTGPGATLTNCTVSGNTARAKGGGIFSNGTTMLTNCTVSDNSAGQEGGAIFNGDTDSGPGTTAELTNCTVTGNSAQQGGGLWNYYNSFNKSGSMTIVDTIVAANTATTSGPDALGNFVSEGNNLIGETDGSSGWVGSDLTGSIAQPLDPLLAPLAYYGGPTETMALLPGSPAIDAGNNALIPNGVTTDQRGYARIVNGTVDIGAFEAQSIPLVVNTTADGIDCPPGELDLRGAIDLANTMTGPETITFDPTVFATAQTITLTAGPLELSNTTGMETIMGPAAGVTVSGGGLFRVFQVDSGVTATLSGVTISGGSSAGYGGGLYNDGGTITLTNCTISGNSAAAGGGLFNTKRGTGTLTGCSMSGNSASLGGALYNDGGTTTLTDSTVSGNSAAAGGGLFNTKRGTATLTGCTVSGNSAATGGGIDNGADGGATLEDTIVAANTGTGGSPSDIGGDSAAGVVGTYDLIGTGGSGGIAGGIGDIILTNLNSLLLAPLGSYGGPTQTMPLRPGSAAIGSGTAITGVSDDQRGFAFGATADIGAFQAQTGLVVNTTIDGTAAPSGDLSLRQAVNLANVLGGAETITFDSTVFATTQTITLTQGQLELNDIGGTETIKGPAAGVTISGGGAVRVFKVDSGVAATLAGLTIKGGLTTSNGGGLYNDGTITLTDVTVTGNSAGAGGGLWNNGAATLTNCTISGNSANLGGGLSNGSDGTTTLTNCTVSGNTGTSDFGGIFLAGTVALDNTIVAANTDSAGGTASDIGGSGTVSGSNNLIGTGGSGGLINGVEGNIVGVASPGLAPLGNYGGPTETMALLPGSAAIGAGTAVSGVTTDQRGASRPTSGAVDIGAFQDQGYTVAVSSGSPQSTLVSQPFNASLVALLTENYADAPLPGATIGFIAPRSGASATLSAGSAVTDASGLATVTATANTTAGTYTVTASATGVTASASYSLTNEIQPSFAELTNQTITYGSTVTFTGTLAAGSQAPAGEEVAVTLGGVTHDATIATDGSFSAQFTYANVVLNASSTAYNVTYDYATDGAFGAAHGSSQLTVKPAALTVRANSVSTVYGSPLPALTYTIAGFVGGDNGSVVRGAPEIATTAGPGANAGTYLITIAAGTLSATNYSFPAADLIAGTLTVTPAPLVITAVSTSMIAGQAIPALTAAYTGFVNGDTPASLTPPPVLQSAASQSSAPGNYAITASGAGSPSYTITYVPGTLTVNLALATVESVKIEKEKLAKHKTTEVIVVQFSEALNMGAAQNTDSYSLGTIPKSKKQKSKAVLLASASYNPSTFTVTLTTRKALVLSPPLDLTITAAGLLDALGRPLSANSVATLTKGGATVASAVPLVQAKGLSAEVVDAVLGAGFRPEVRRVTRAVS